MKNEGLLVVVSGPSGAGKGTVLKTFLENNKNAFYSVSATTRAPRPGEEDGKDYYFMEKSDFLALKENNGFLESACFCENYYGTPRKQVMDKIESGMHVILEIEVQGAMQIKTSYPSAVFVFIVPPSLEELRRRLVGRNTETEEVIEKRLATAKTELGFVQEYDYMIINDTPEEAARKLEQILQAEGNRVNRNLEFVKEKLQ